MNNLLQDFVFISKYARANNGKKETWDEAVDRIMGMHREFLTIRYSMDPAVLEPLLQEVEAAYKRQEILGAQRALQWGGDQLLSKHSRMYNCASSYADRVEYFPQLMFLLLSGAGVGYSAQKVHVNKLPVVQGVGKSLTYTTFKASDSIEGWADVMKILFESYFYHWAEPEFDYSAIREKGAFISGGFKAPGPEPLAKAVELCREILKKASGRKLTTVETSDLSCIIADSVISGGVRRAALLALFSVDDKDFINYKTGDWFYKHPYRARANISAVVLSTTKFEAYSEIFKAAKQFGEPGIAFLSDEDEAFNPCFEVGMYPQIDGQSGFSFCNLTEIVGKHVKTAEDFYRACRVGAIMGTLQAAYTDFPYLGSTTEQIVRRDALIGVGITGMAESPEILFDKEVQRHGAKIVKQTNAEVAKLLGINPAARCTVIKPSGNSAAMTGTSSGIHPFHAKRYIRNVQVNKNEQAGKVIAESNKAQSRESVYNGNDIILSFPMELEDGVLTRHDDSPIEFLERVKSTQRNWIEHGTNFLHPSFAEKPSLRHNVSNTCTVGDGEWDGVRDYLWENRQYFCGVSLLPSSGDLDYPQAPFTEVLDEIELSELYGAAAILAGGLNVDAIHAFGDLWRAIDCALGNGETLDLNMKNVLDTISSNMVTSDSGVEFVHFVEGLRVDSVNAIIAQEEAILAKKREWVGRFNRFASKYLKNDLKTTGRCLKQVSIFHQWQQLQLIKPIDWNDVVWDQVYKDSGDNVGSACSGGKCEVIQ